MLPVPKSFPTGEGVDTRNGDTYGGGLYLKTAYTYVVSINLAHCRYYSASRARGLALFPDHSRQLEVGTAWERGSAWLFHLASFPGLQSQLTQWIMEGLVKLLRRMTSGGRMVDAGCLEAW